MLLLMRDKQDLVFLMVETYSQQSVERTQEVLKEMNRTDLVQRLSESHSGPKKKPSVDEHLSALIHKVATMMAVKELLLETLKDLNSEEMKNFKLLLQFMFFQKGLPLISWTRMLKTSWPETLVSMMVEICGQQSVEVTREVFMDMNRTDLVQRLSETSSRPKEKHSVDEHCPALIQKVEMMASVTELLLETLAGLSNSELNSISISQSPPSFKHVLLSHSDFYRYVSDIPWIWLKMYDMQDLVFLLVLTYGQQSVEETKDVLKRMNKTDLVQRLSDSSSGHKKKHFADKHRSALIQKVATMAAVKQLLLETLNDLSNEGLEKFKEYLQLTFHQRDLPDVSSMLLHRTDKVKIVDLMVQTCGQRSVEVTREVFMDMKRTDLVHRLSKPSSGLKEKHSVDEHRPTLSEKAAAMAAVKQILLETLKDLSLNELEKFKWLLHFTYFQKSLPQISWSKLDWVDSVDLLVDMMVKNRQSVEVTKEVLMDMNRTDLVKRLSETSSGLKEKHEFKAFQKEVPMTSLKEKLFKTLQDLSHRELQKFKQLLQQTEMKKGPRHRMETAGSVDIATLMMEIYGRQSVEVTSKVLKKMNRTDLVQRLSDSSSGSKVPVPE
ncbi:uncharacterized protein [Enoplosus armatus]|uniref:uncharacterized protein n=1 Tax=Enoplosus armatus TaxID=215367 RepID=UPI0039918864